MGRPKKKKIGRPAVKKKAVKKARKKTYRKTAPKKNDLPDYVKGRFVVKAEGFLYNGLSASGFTEDVLKAVVFPSRAAAEEFLQANEELFANTDAEAVPFNSLAENSYQVVYTPDKPRDISIQVSVVPKGGGVTFKKTVANLKSLLLGQIKDQKAELKATIKEHQFYVKTEMQSIREKERDLAAIETRLSRYG